MTPAAVRPAVRRLAADLLGAADDDAPSAELVEWLSLSNRFRAFAEEHRDKIRKKLRGATDEEARRDVRAELRTARLLLEDRRIELAFEAYGSGNPGPDFTLSFRGHVAFNLEVTRSQRAPDSDRLAELLLAKLRQLPPSVANALLLVVEGPEGPVVDVDAAVRALRGRADRKEDEHFKARGHSTSRAFYDRFLRLGGIFVLDERDAEEPGTTLWTNRSARIALPERAATACLQALLPP